MADHLVLVCRTIDKVAVGTMVAHQEPYNSGSPEVCGCPMVEAGYYDPHVNGIDGDWVESIKDDLDLLYRCSAFMSRFDTSAAWDSRVSIHEVPQSYVNIEED